VAGQVRYIVLSDLHFGAENSILTRLHQGTTLADVKPGEPPWSTFAAAVDQLVGERREAMREILEGDLKLLRD
jgi:metallophosphoesterase superfamily enzyme